MDIICFIPNLEAGGAERQLTNLAVLWKKKGHNVRFITYHRQVFYRDILDKHNIPVYQFIYKSKFVLIYNLYRFLNKENVDVVVSFLYTPNTIMGLLSFLPHRWKLFTSELSFRENFNKGIRGKLLVHTQKRVNMLVANSDIGASLWTKKEPWISKRICTIYNPVILGKITPNSYIPLRNNKLHIVVAASYQELKNMKGLISGVSLLTDEEKTKLRIDWYGNKYVGTGNTLAYEDAYKSLKFHKLDSAIFLNDATKDIHDKMYSADIIALFSKFEGLPNAICEGMMIGKPIIMTKVSDYNKLISCENGKLCDWNNPESIRDAIRYFLNCTKEDLCAMGKKSQERAQVLFDSELITNKWMELFTK